MANTSWSSDDEAKIFAAQKERARTLLSCIRTPEDVEKLQAAGVIAECFKAFDNYADVFNYLVDRAILGKPAHREDVRKAYGVDLLAGVGDISLYAEQVVRDYRERAVIRAIEKFYEEIDSKDITQSIRDLKNTLTYITLTANDKVGRLVHGWMEEPEPLEWLIDGILPAQWPTFFYGKGGTAKSYLLLAIACCVATGRNFLAYPVRKKVNVLYLDWEMDYKTFYRRLAEVCRGFEVGESRVGKTGKVEWNVPGLYYINMDEPLNRKLADIQEIIAEYNIGLVIIDSFGFSMGEGKELEKSGPALDYMRIISSIPCSVAVIDHVSKTKSDDGTPFGSVYKLNSCRWAWWITAVSNPSPADNDGQEFPEGTYQRWRNTKHNMAARQKDFYAMFQWEKVDDNRFSFTARFITENQAPVEIGGTPTGISRSQVMSALENHPTARRIHKVLTLSAPEWLDIAEIVEATGYNRKTVEAALDWLLKRRLITESHRATGTRGRPRLAYSALRDDSPLPKSIEFDDIADL